MIIAVGHTPEKMEHMLSMIPPEFAYKAIFNGERDKRYWQTANNTDWRDVGMYGYGVISTIGERFFCLNDDVQYVDETVWIDYCHYLNEINPPEIVGVGNLASWIDHNDIQGEVLEWAERQGRELKFIRTSGFFCTRQYFLNLWLASNNAQEFEKGTLQYTNHYRLMNPRHLYDSNIAAYV